MTYPFSAGISLALSAQRKRKINTMSDEKMVPVSEAIRYRSRAQKAELAVEELQAQLAEKPILGPIGGDLRDWFAGLATIGPLSDITRVALMKDLAEKSGRTYAEELAGQSYDVANAMIAERNKTNIRQ